jgi:predicted sulfurtransferase
MTQCPYNICKQVFHILGGPCRCLHEITAEALGEFSTFVVRHFTFDDRVALVTNEEEDGITAFDTVH